MPFLFWLIGKASFGLEQARIRILGDEWAGDVDSVGREVKRFKPGDQVFGFTGQRFGANAEFLCWPRVLRWPISRQRDHGGGRRHPLWALMACPFCAGRTSSRAEDPDQRGQRRDRLGRVQIAKHLGAEVTAVCGGPDWNSSAPGADRAIDYEEQDFTRNGETYDVIFDILARRIFRAAGIRSSPAEFSSTPASRPGISFDDPDVPVARGGSSARSRQEASRICWRSKNWSRPGRSRRSSTGVSPWTAPPTLTAMSRPGAGLGPWSS